MILDMLDGGDTRTFTLVYGASNRKELYDHDFFVEPAKTRANFRHVPARRARHLENLPRRNTAMSATTGHCSCRLSQELDSSMLTVFIGLT